MKPIEFFLKLSFWVDRSAVEHTLGQLSRQFDGRSFPEVAIKESSVIFNGRLEDTQEIARAFCEQIGISPSAYRIQEELDESHDVVIKIYWNTPNLKNRDQLILQLLTDKQIDSTIESSDKNTLLMSVKSVEDRNRALSIFKDCPLQFVAMASIVYEESDWNYE